MLQGRDLHPRRVHAVVLLSSGFYRTLLVRRFATNSAAATATMITRQTWPLVVRNAELYGSQRHRPRLLGGNKCYLAVGLFFFWFGPRT